MSARRVSLVVLLVAGGAFVVLSAVLVPWSPVPGGTPSPVPVEDVFTATEVARAEDFTGTLRTWSALSMLVNLAVLALLAASARVRAAVSRLPGPWWAQALLAVLVVEVVSRLATLTFSVLQRRHVLDAGLSDQSWAGFARDAAVSEAVDVAVTGLLVVVLVGVARRWRTAWPAVVGVTVAVLVALGSFAYPVVVEPLFNRFTPLPDGELRSGVLALAEAEGVPVDEVLVSDASRRTTTLNAYVAGFGGTRRVVLYDNLVEDVPTREALTVVAHELAHARNDDVLLGTALGALGAATAVGLLGVALGRRRLGDPRVVPVLLVLLAAGTLVTAPVQSGISRRIELRADVDALRYTTDPDAFVALQRRLSLRSLSDPTPPALWHWAFGTHPTVLVRVALARS